MQDIFGCNLLEAVVIPNFGLGSVVLIRVKCAHRLEREGANAFKGGICAQLGKVLLGLRGSGVLAEAQAEIR